MNNVRTTGDINGIARLVRIADHPRVAEATRQDIRTTLSAIDPQTISRVAIESFSPAQNAFFKEAISAVPAQEIDLKVVEDLSLKVFMRAINLLPIPIHVLDHEGHFISVNKAWEEVFGSPENGSFRSILSPADQADASIRFEQKRNGESVDPKDRTYIGENGNVIAQYWETFIREENGNTRMVITVVADLTARHQRIERKIIAEKLGPLAEAIGHNYNNLIWPIFARVEMIARKAFDNKRILDNATPGNLELPDDLNYSREELLLNTKAIIAGTNEISSLFLRMRAFTSRLVQYLKWGAGMIYRAPFSPDFFDNYIIGTSAQYLDNPHLGHQIKTTISISSGDLTLDGDKDAIACAIGELFKNAIDAAGDVNKVSCTIRQRKVKNNGGPNVTDFRGFAIPEGEYVEIMVKDEGKGIPQKDREHIFDAAFSTKDEAVHVGLGLTIVREVTIAHHGYLNVESKEGKGSSFHIYLPVVKKTA
ncbi:MAG: ATP-binding protein [Candidatus Margulisiibacteriota bacterium]